MGLPMNERPKQLHDMKLAFIDVKYKPQITLPATFLERLPQKVILFTNIQFHNQYDKLREQIEQTGKEVISVRPKHAWNEGQILGCSIENWKDKGADGFIYIGDGYFHPKAILFQNEEPVYMYNPKNKKEEILTQEKIDRILKRKKGAFLTFHVSKNVGVLITTKYGQNRLKEAIALEQKFPDKTFYFLIDDVLNFQSLEDFPFLEVFVNTACPRVMDDHDKLPKPVLNIEDLTKEEW